MFNSRLATDASFALAEGLGDLFGSGDNLFITAIIITVLIVGIQLFWLYVMRKRSKKTASSVLQEAGSKTKNGTESDGERMMQCPECGGLTEVEYRFCQNCASDTGKSDSGLTEADESNESGMV